MKNSFLFLLAFLFISAGLIAQETSLTKEFKQSTITELNTLMADHYVFPDVAKKTSDHLNYKLKSGYFDQFTTIDAFAEALTEQVQHINHDKHMRVRAKKAATQEMGLADEFLHQHMYYMNKNRESLAGFKAAKKLDGNVGYLSISYFAGLKQGAAIADAYMQLLSTSDAVMVDLRKNGGGNPAMVQYLCSYFFAEEVHLNSLYWRAKDKTQEFWTVDVKGEKMADVPLIILTSEKTFSGAEEFAYNMQTQKRAKLVGQITGGGANPGGSFPVNEKLTIFIPTGKAINPITGTNWEGTGVKPDIEASEDDTWDKAYEVAKTAAEEYRQQKEETYAAISKKLTYKLSLISDKTSDADMAGIQEGVNWALKKGVKTKLFNESDINMMGYHFLQNEAAPSAEVIFKGNVLLFPYSANVYDSYAECLAKIGKMKESLTNYSKAVEIAKQNDDPMLELFEKNLTMIKEKVNP